MKLTFNNETTQLFIVDREISQSLSVLSILFLIYIDGLFKKNHYLTRKLTIKIISYIDDIAARIVLTKTFQKNC